MIKKSKQAKFGEHIFNTIEENPMRLAECTLKICSIIPIKRKQRASPSQRFTVFENFAKTSWVLFPKNVL